jgi:hypothetical protein
MGCDAAPDLGCRDLDVARGLMEGSRREPAVSVGRVTEELREGWYNDPTGRHSERWYVAGRMTSVVRDGAVESRDQVSAAHWADTPVSAREGWHTDPLRRHECRWFSAGMPTGLVRDGEMDGHDPLDPAELGEASFAAAELLPWLPDPPHPFPDGQGPAASWDGWVAGPGEPRRKWGLDGATGLGIDAAMRVAMRRSSGVSDLRVDMRLLAAAVVVIGIGAGCLFTVALPVGVLMIAAGFLLLVGMVLFGTFDFFKALRVRRFEKRLALRDQTFERDGPSACR